MSKTLLVFHHPFPPDCSSLASRIFWPWLIKLPVQYCKRS